MRFTPRFSAALLATIVVLGACSSNAAIEASSSEPDAGETAVLAAAVDADAEAETEAVTAPEEGPVETDDLEATAVPEQDESIVLEPELVEVALVDWEYLEAGEISLEVVRTVACADGSCAAGDALAVVALSGITRFQIPVLVAPETFEVVEVSEAEFRFYLEGEDRDPLDQVIVSLDPSFDVDAAEGLLTPRIASEIVVIG